MLPTHRSDPAEVLRRLRDNRHDDAPWREGRIFSLVYHPDDPVLEELLAAVSREYLAENALNPVRFPSLARLERETADMVSDLLHGPANAAGLTAGGTESIFVAVQVARKVARDRGIERPEVVTGLAAHPAFAKACHLLDVRHTRVPLRADLRTDPDALRAAIGPDTAMVVASAPCYPYGLIDPVTEIAAAARDSGVLCHVDACLGGLLMPFWPDPLPPWDFRVDGVTSISADVHKYGWSFKGASVIAFATEALSYERIWFDDGAWGGGIYGSATPAGTRPAPPIAGAWAALSHLGREGYEAKARAVHAATRTIQDGVRALGLRVTSDPDLSVFQVEGDLDMAAVGDALEERRWWLDRQPGGLHLMVSPVHARVAGDLLAALAEAVAEVRAGRTSAGAEARYA